MALQKACSRAPCFDTWPFSINGPISGMCPKIIFHNRPRLSMKASGAVSLYRSNFNCIHFHSCTRPHEQTYLQRLLMQKRQYLQAVPDLLTTQSLLWHILKAACSRLRYMTDINKNMRWGTRPLYHGLAWLYMPTTKWKKEVLNVIYSRAVM